MSGVGPLVSPCVSLKAKEFQDWIDNEIKRASDDLRILEPIMPTVFRSIGSNARYSGLTSDEMAIKLSEDQEKIKDLNKYLEFLHFTRGANIDVDAIARICCNEFNLLIPKTKGYPILNGKIMGKFCTIKFEWQIGFLLRVSQHDNSNPNFLFTRFYWLGNAKIDEVNSTSIRWILGNNINLEIDTHGNIYVANKIFI